MGWGGCDGSVECGVWLSKMCRCNRVGGRDEVSVMGQWGSVAR